MAAIFVEPQLYGLTCAEAMALRLWSGSDHHADRIATMLRNGLSAFGDYQFMIDTLDSALSKMPSTKATVFRGINIGYMRKFQDRYLPGTIHRWNSFTSASQLEQRAFGGNVLFAINSLSGRPISAFADDYEEREVLFPRGCRFIVTKVAYPGVKAVIELREL